MEGLVGGKPISQDSLLAAALVADGMKPWKVAETLGVSVKRVRHAVEDSRRREAAEQAPPHYASAWGARRDVHI